MGIGVALLGAVLVLSILLATLPGRQSLLADTISTDAHGPHGRLVFWVLLLFGLGTAAFALSLGVRLRGRAGVACGLLVAVWSAAAIFDAFVPSPTVHVGTAFGQVHTIAAVAGIVAQLLVALLLLAVVCRRYGRVGSPLRLATAAVLAGGAFVIVHPDSLAGLCERLLFAASAGWMITSVGSVGTARDAGTGHRVETDRTVGITKVGVIQWYSNLPVPELDHGVPTPELPPDLHEQAAVHQIEVPSVDRSSPDVGPPRLTERQRRQIRARSAAGESSRRVAAELGLSRTSVLGVLAAAGETQPCNRIRTPELVAEAKRLREQGLLFREIAEQLDISKDAARTWVQSG